MWNPTNWFQDCTRGSIKNKNNVGTAMKGSFQIQHTSRDLCYLVLFYCTAVSTHNLMGQSYHNTIHHISFCLICVFWFPLAIGWNKDMENYAYTECYVLPFLWKILHSSSPLLKKVKESEVFHCRCDGC